MLLDSRYSVSWACCPPQDCERIHRLLSAVGLPLWDDRLLTPGQAGNGSDRLAVLKGLDDFREHLGGDLTVTLLRGIGQAVDVHEMGDARC